jgi:hypothetical protein
MYEALWSLSCDSMRSLTWARVGRASGAEKLSARPRTSESDLIGFW